MEGGCWGDRCMLTKCPIRLTFSGQARPLASKDPGEIFRQPPPSISYRSRDHPDFHRQFQNRNLKLFAFPSLRSSLPPSRHHLVSSRQFTSTSSLSLPVHKNELLLQHGRAADFRPKRRQHPSTFISTSHTKSAFRHSQAKDYNSTVTYTISTHNARCPNRFYRGCLRGDNSGDRETENHEIGLPENFRSCQPRLRRQAVRSKTLSPSRTTKGKAEQ